MRIDGFALHPYRLPLTEPVAFGGTALAHREGVLLRLGTEGGLVGWGDAAPLPRFSRETLEEARDALEVFAAALVGRDVAPNEAVAWDGPLHAALDATGLPSSARFALDLALADLAAQAHGRPLPQLLHPDPTVTLSIQGLLMGEADAVLDRAERLVRDGYRTLKLKVGRRDLDADVELVNGVRGRVGAGIALRLDANRAWTDDEARRFAEGIAGAGIDYVEEPLRAPAGLPALWLDTGLPIALDETLAVPEGAALLRGWAEAAVLKPTVLGGLAATLRWARQARQVGVRPVLSAAFESGVGLRGVAALAAATGAEAVGLDPYRRLAGDVLGERLPFDRPTVDLPRLFAHQPRVAPER